MMTNWPESYSVTTEEGRLKLLTIAIILGLSLVDAWGLDTLTIAFSSRNAPPIFFAAGIDTVFLTLMVIAHFVYTTTSYQRFAKVLELAALTGTIFMLLGVFSYLAMAYSGAFPYRDALLLQLDIIIGYRWETFARWVGGTKLMLVLMQFAYFMFLPEVQLALGAFIYLRKEVRFYGVILAFLLAGSICCVISGIMPAQSVFNTVAINMAGLEDFSFGAGADVAATLEALRTGTFGSFAAHQSIGIITFPSFHSAIAAIMIWAFWYQRMLRWAVLLLNMVMCVAALYVGGHYLVDVIAGVAVGFVCAAIVVRIGANKQADPV